MNKKWLILLLLSLPLVGTASSLHKTYRSGDLLGVQALIILHAHNQEHLERQLQLFESLRKQRFVCQSQLKQKHVPFACFYLIKLEEKLHLLPKRQLLMASQHLNDVCVTNLAYSSEAKASPQLKNSLDQHDLSPKCQQALSNKIAVLRYADVEENSVRLFEARLSN